MSEKNSGRRTFLKGAAATLAATTVTAQAPAAEKPAAKSSGAGPDHTISRPGSDFMVDVLRSLNIDYVASNPASSFRSFHESIVNYGGNRKPEFLTCLHEESSVAMAHGYYKASGKMMAMMAHGSVGIQHAAMAVYNAWCDRVPVMLIGGNFMDAAQRRPGVEWAHCSQSPAALLRDYIKWDDQPASLQHFAESTVRAYKMAMTPPMEPVMIVADGMLQEDPIENEKQLAIPKLVLSAPPQGETGAVREAAKLLAAAQNPVIVCERVARNQEGMKLMVELAEALNAPVVDLLGRMNFPTTHYLSRTSDGRALVGGADAILFLEVGDPWGQLNSISDPHHEYRRIAKPDVKLIHITLADQLMKSNYQDMQRFCPVDISISADVQATLPSLIESIKKQSSNARAGRTEALRKDHQQMKARIRESATLGWDASPVSTARLHAELWQVLKNENWCLAECRSGSWAARLWPATQHHNFLGQSGGAGVGYIAPAAVGAALANKDKGIITAVVQPDGDLMYAPGVLWTAAHHRIPLLSVMHNNRAYHQEVMHLQKMAGLHNRRMDTARIGTTIEDPNIDYAKLAQAQGVWAEGPITDPAKIGPALQRAMAVVKKGEPALVDIVTQGR
ncbi:MAG: acetolactate synthase large subunit [Betaproteobacteria bacterium]|jgi:thiamine pyrophosphate-dependent acetolactate synthase large subunit-like protein|nr:acetolactate synthase large subunit [Betaproteobacteria bacterium]